MQPNKLTEEEKKGLGGPHDALLFECQCHGYHYLQLSNWFDDEEFEKNPDWFNKGIWNDQWGEVSMVFVDQPTTFWQMLKTWWKHRNWYTNDIILSPDDIKVLISKLKEYDDKYEQRKAEVAARAGNKPTAVAIPGFSDEPNTVSPTVPS